MLQTRSRHEAAGRAFSPRPCGDRKPQKSMFVGNQSRGAMQALSPPGWGCPLYNGVSLTSNNSRGNWNKSGVHPELLTFTAPDAHDLSQLPMASFFKRLLFERTFFFLPSKLMGNTLSQRESQHFERLQHCTQKPRNPLLPLSGVGGRAAERQRQGAEENFRC